MATALRSRIDALLATRVAELGGSRPVLKRLFGVVGRPIGRPIGRSTERSVGLPRAVAEGAS